MRRKTAFCISILLLLCLCACKNSRAVPEPADIPPTESEPEEQVTVVPEKEEKNGFNEASNVDYTIGGITFSVPDYYKEERVDESRIGFLAYEEEIPVSLLYFIYSESSEKIVYGQLEDVWDQAKESLINSVENCEVLASDDISVAGWIGKSFSFLGTQEDGVATLIVDLINGNRAIEITFLQDENSKYDYLSDYEKILNSAVPAPEEVQDTNPTPSQTPSDNIRPDFKQAMDSYEKFFDEYIAFMKEYQTSDNPLGMITEYLEFMTQYSEAMEDLQNMDTTSMTPAESAYYTEVMLRINQKLYDSVLS